MALASGLMASDMASHGDGCVKAAVRCCLSKHLDEDAAERRIRSLPDSVHQLMSEEVLEDLQEEYEYFVEAQQRRGRKHEGKDLDFEAKTLARPARRHRNKAEASAEFIPRWLQQCFSPTPEDHSGRTTAERFVSGPTFPCLRSNEEAVDDPDNLAPHLQHLLDVSLDAMKTPRRKVTVDNVFITAPQQRLIDMSLTAAQTPRPGDQRRLNDVLVDEGFLDPDTLRAPEEQEGLPFGFLAQEKTGIPPRLYPVFIPDLEKEVSWDGDSDEPPVFLAMAKHQNRELDAEEEYDIWMAAQQKLGEEQEAAERQRWLTETWEKLRSAVGFKDRSQPAVSVSVHIGPSGLANVSLLSTNEARSLRWQREIEQRMNELRGWASDTRTFFMDAWQSAMEASQAAWGATSEASTSAPAAYAVSNSRSQAAPETSTQRAERIWRGIDTDGSGFIDKDELFRHVAATSDVGPAMAARVFEALDTNNDGNIELSEWLRVYGEGST